jgi:hypothetical protein
VKLEITTIALLLSVGCSPPSLTSASNSETGFAANSSADSQTKTDTEKANVDDSIFERRPEGSPSDEIPEIEIANDITGAWLSMPEGVTPIGTAKRANEEVAVSPPRISDKAIGIFRVTRTNGEIRYHYAPVVDDEPIQIEAGSQFQFGTLAAEVLEKASMRIPPIEVNVTRKNDSEVGIEIEIHEEADQLGKMRLLRSAVVPRAGYQPCPQTPNGAPPANWPEIYGLPLSSTVSVGSISLSDSSTATTLVYALCIYNRRGKLVTFPNLYAPSPPNDVTSITQFIRPALDAQHGLFMQLVRIPAESLKLPDLTIEPLKGFVTGYIDVEEQTYTAGFPGFPNLTSDFGLAYSGYLLVPSAGEYEFELTSDDGSKLFINDQLVVDNDGKHDSQARVESISIKKAGYVKFGLNYYQGPTEVHLQVKWRKAGADSQFVTIPASAYFLNSGTTIMTGVADALKD